ncbi:MAG: PAS domain-containing protein [Sulfuricurvum sp.]
MSTPPAPKRFQLGPLDIEVKVDSKREILSETDAKGVITQANDYFIELSAYTKEELLGAPHNIVRHPDMPKTVFKILWDNLKAGNKYKAIVKNRRKDGKYYWVYSEYEPIFEKNRVIRGYRSRRWPVPKKTVEDVEMIYKKILELEETKSQQEAEMFLELKLHNDGYHNYAEFIEDLYNKRFKGLFGFLSKIFGR